MASTYSPQVREQSNSFHSGADHPRISICDVCQLSPASVTCKADSASLCSSCDRDIHHANPLASRHHRLPFVPFFDSVSATNASAFILPDDLDTFLEENRIYGADSVVPIQTLKSNDGFQVDFAQSTFDFSPQCFSQSVKQAIEDRGVEEAKEDHSPSPPPANPVKEEKVIAGTFNLLDLDYPPPVENKALALTIVPFGLKEKVPRMLYSVQGRIGGAIFPIQSHNLLSMLLIQAISTGLQ